MAGIVSVRALQRPHVWGYFDCPTVGCHSGPLLRRVCFFGFFKVINISYHVNQSIFNPSHHETKDTFIALTLSLFNLLLCKMVVTFCFSVIDLPQVGTWFWEITTY